MAAHACNLSTWKMEAGQEFKVIFDYSKLEISLGLYEILYKLKGKIFEDTLVLEAPHAWEIPRCKLASSP